VLTLKWLVDLCCGSDKCLYLFALLAGHLGPVSKGGCLFEVVSVSRSSERIGPETTDDPLWASDDEFDHDVSSLEGGSESRASEV